MLWLKALALIGAVLFTTLGVPAQAQAPAPSARVAELRQTIAQSEGRERLEAYSRLVEALASTDVAAALQAAEEGLVIARREQDVFAEGKLLNSRGFTLSMAGRDAEAFESIEQARQRFEQIGNAELLARAHSNLGSILLDWGDPERALQHFLEHNRNAIAAGHRGLQASSLINIGSVREAMGQDQTALESYAQALEILENEPRDRGNDSRRAKALQSSASVLIRLGQAEQARGMLQAALPFAEAGINPNIHIEVLRALAAAERMLGRRDRALLWLNEADVVASRVGSGQQLARTALVRAETILSHDPAGALRFANSALSTFRADELPTDERDALLLRSRTYEALRQWDRALADERAATVLTQRLLGEEATRAVASAEARFNVRALEERTAASEAQQRAQAEVLALQRRLLWSVAAVALLLLMGGLAAALAARRERKQRLLISEQRTSLAEKSDALQSALQEREVLFRELIHRVRNNLQALMSMLRLERRRLDHGAAAPAAAQRDVLRDVQGRVETMAFVHDAFHTADATAIDARVLLETIPHQAAAIHGRHVELQVEAPSRALPMEVAAPLGLIVWELVSNAIEHGLSETPDARIDVRFIEEGDTAALSVRDYGRGLPAGFSFESLTSLGLTLVRDLAQQIGGALVQEPAEAGVHWSVQFPLRQPATA